MEHGIACCATYYPAIATLTQSTTAPNQVASASATTVTTAIARGTISAFRIMFGAKKVKLELPKKFRGDSS